jgi:hypothetical protein
VHWGVRAGTALALIALLATGVKSGEAAGKGPPPQADPWPELDMRELSPKEWLRRVQEKISQKYDVDPAQMRLSPAPPKLVAFVRGPAPPKPGKKVKRPRRHDIVVVDVLGQKRGQWRVLTAPRSDEPPKDLRFLDDDRLVYEVVESPPPPQKQKRASSKKVSKKAKAAANVASKKAAAPAEPRRFFVIQPVGRRARAIRCQGQQFIFTGRHDRLAFVGGTPGKAFVSVNGKQVYPRRGKTVIASDLVWSRDGLGLAFLETPAKKPPRLVLLGAYDNPREDATWDLPPTAELDGARVFWTRPGKLVVGKTTTRPFFSASFDREDASAADTFTP